MSELLQNWLNNEVGLSTNVANFERDFSNGYLFGEILHKFRQQDDFDRFKNNGSYEAKISNFKLLEPTLTSLGIKFNAAQSNGIMAGERGASLRLLYQMKMATERLLLATDVAGPYLQGTNAPGGNITKGIRIPRETFDSHERNFFQHRLHATCQNVKQERVNRVTRRYEDERHKQEIVAREMDNVDQARLGSLREIHRYSLRERMRQNMVAKSNWNQQSYELWAETMQVRLEREDKSIEFERKMRSKYQDKLNRTRVNKTNEVRDGVEVFERGLVDLGIVTLKNEAPRGLDESSDSERSENAPERLLAQTTLASNAQEFVESLQAGMPSPQELEQEAGLFLRKIKESKHASSVARRERERRRRRVLVEEQHEQDLMEEGKLEEALLETLSRESIEEQKISYMAWKTKKYEEVIVQNRQLRTRQEQAYRKRDQQDAVVRDRAILEEYIEVLRENEERNRLQYRAIERGRIAGELAKVSEESEEILKLVENIALACLQQEQLTGKQKIDETLWREWMVLFVENIAVPPQTPLEESVATMFPLQAAPPPLPVPDDTPSILLGESGLRDFVEARGQWALALPVPMVTEESLEDSKVPDPVTGTLEHAFDPIAEMQRLVTQSPAGLSYRDRLKADIHVIDQRPVNYRLGSIVASVLDRRFAAPPQPAPPPMPEVPIRLVMVGKPFAGKKVAATRLAETFNLEIIDVDSLVKEALQLSRRPDMGTTKPIDWMSFTADQNDEDCQREEEAGNPYRKQLQLIGYEMQDRLDRGETLRTEDYVNLITTKIRSLFPGHIPRPDAAPEVLSEHEDEELLESFGWILVGFPEDRPQFEVLERFLTGWVAPEAIPVPLAEIKKAEAALIAPRPFEAPTPFARLRGGYDLHLHLHISLDESVRRAAGRRVDPTTGLTYHIEDMAPTGKNQVIFERLVPIDDLTKSMGSLTYRIHSFDIAQQELELMLAHFGPFPDQPRLVYIDASKPTEGVYESVEEQVSMLLDRKREALAEQRAAAKAEREEALAAEKAKAAEKEARDALGAADEFPRPPTPEPVEDPKSKGKKPAPPKEVAHVPVAVVEPEEAVEEPIPPPLELAQLKPYVDKLEEPILNLLEKEWGELQDNFTSAIRELSFWHRGHLREFWKGLHGLQQRFVWFVQRTDDKQVLVDEFINRFNQFSEIYPNMRSQEAFKDEFHQEADDLRNKLEGKVNTRRDESQKYLDEVEQTKWVEAQLETFASQIQYAFQLEVKRYHMACQFLSDFYYGAMGEVLPPPKEPVPTLDALAEKVEKPPEEEVSKKGAPKAKAQAKGAPAVEEPPPVDPAVARAERIRKRVPPKPSLEGGGNESRMLAWEFPFLAELVTQSKTVIWALTEYAAAVVKEEADQEALAAAAKAKAKAKAKAAPAESEAPSLPKKPAPALFVDMQQALLAESVVYNHRVEVIRSWAERRLLAISATADEVLENLRDWVLLRRRKELDAVHSLTDILKAHVESEKLIHSRLTLVGAHLHTQGSNTFDRPS